MAKPNILILMVDQLNGTLFPDGPADWLHAPHLKALAAQANDVPFYAALPESTIDWTCRDGAEIPIEERDASEVLSIAGLDASGTRREVNLAGAATSALNQAFDVTPAQHVRGLITDYGTFDASEAGLQKMRSVIQRG